MTKIRDESTPCSDGSDVHPVRVTHEDADSVQGTCTRCGADLDADKAEPGFGS